MRLDKLKSSFGSGGTVMISETEVTPLASISLPSGIEFVSR